MFSKKWISIGVILGLTFSVIVNSPAQSRNHKPTLAQIEAAKKEERAKKKIADEAKKKLDRAKGSLKALTEVARRSEAVYQSARRELDVATSQLKIATSNYQAAIESVSFTNREIGKLAINAYISGGGLSDLEMVLDAAGPQEIIERLSTLENLGSGNRTALKRFKAAELIAEEARVVAEVARVRQATVTSKVAEAKRIADEARAEQQAEVDKLQGVQDKLQRDLNSAMKVRITLEQRRQLAILEETRANEATKVTGQSKVWRTGGPNGKSTFRTSKAQREMAVQFAKTQVLAKRPYVWGDEGPRSFDCSGLVYAAYKHAGLGWPIWDRLNSGLYYTYTKQIPLAEMEPGDLLFYSYKGTINTIHHVSIYAGNGMMWEARSTASGLRYSDIYSMPGMMPYAGRV